MLDFEFASYDALRRMRRDLAQLKPLDDFALFARSMVSSGDARLMRQVARKTQSGNVAGQIFLELFSMGGVGNLTPDITVWLERPEDSSDALVYGGLVLGSLAKDLADGTALRALMEFAHHDDVRLNRDRTIEALGEARFAQLFRMSREEQIGDLLQSWGDDTGSRPLWLLRTYVDQPVVEEYLRRHAAEGRLEAVVSLFFKDGTLEWELFDEIRSDSAGDRRMALNLAIENLARGAGFGDLERSRFGSRLEPTDRKAIDEALETLASDGDSPDGARS